MIDRMKDHERIALQFSGGKDSLALVWLLQPEWPRLTIYHIDTGDLLPEVMAVVADVENRVPSFVRINTQSEAWRAANGLPSDLVPTHSTRIGRMFGRSSQPIVDRWECCALNISAPMHHRMLADGITLVIRGTKRSDAPALPAIDGDTSLGYEVYLPIQEWSHADVFAYLAEKGIRLPAFYEDRIQAPECATCSAWWGERRAGYLKEHHPDLFRKYAANLKALEREIRPLTADFDSEWSEL